MIRLIAIILIASSIIVIGLYWFAAHLPSRWQYECKRYLLPLLITIGLTVYPFHQPQFWWLFGFAVFLLMELIMAILGGRSCLSYAAGMSVLLTPSMSYPFLVSPAVMNPFIESYAPYFRTWSPMFQISGVSVPGNWRLLVLSVFLIATSFLLSRKYCRKISKESDGVASRGEYNG